jgi:hypothetical protein
MRRAHRLQCVEQQGRLADAGLAADEHERRRHDAAAEHAVELGHARRDALRFLRVDVDEAEQRLRRRLRSRDLADDLLDQRAERRAAGALAEPAPGGRAALGAGELNGRFCHAVQSTDEGGRLRHVSPAFG